MIKKSKKLKTKKALLLLFITFVVVSGFANYKYPSHKEICLKINYIERILKTPINNGEFNSVEYQNCEWSLFSLSFSTYALTNITFIDSTFKEKSIELIDSAIQKTLDKNVYSCYFNDSPYEPNINKQGSILYFGHLNLMLGCYRLLSNNPKYNKLNDSLSASLFNRYSNADYMCLESYLSSIWIPDNTVALASLKIHSQNTGSKYEEICNKWIEYAKLHFIDEKTGLLCSKISPATGEIMEEPRGSMIGWSIFFIYRFDKDFAQEQYNIYKSKFSNNLLIFRLFKERYKNRQTDLYGDIDSGPIIIGYSIPAIAFAFGDAVAFKDYKNAKRLQRVIKLGSKKTKNNDEISYKTRFIDMDISPLAEALILYFETMTEWEKQ